MPPAQRSNAASSGESVASSGGSAASNPALESAAFKQRSGGRYHRPEALPGLPAGHPLLAAASLSRYKQQPQRPPMPPGGAQAPAAGGVDATDEAAPVIAAKVKDAREGVRGPQAPDAVDDAAGAAAVKSAAQERRAAMLRRGASMPHTRRTGSGGGDAEQHSPPRVAAVAAAAAAALRSPADLSAQLLKRQRSSRRSVAAEAPVGAADGGAGVDAVADPTSAASSRHRILYHSQSVPRRVSSATERPSAPRRVSAVSLRILPDGGAQSGGAASVLKRQDSHQGGGGGGEAELTGSKPPLGRALSRRSSAVSRRGVSGRRHSSLALTLSSEHTASSWAPAPAVTVPASVEESTLQIVTSALFMSFLYASRTLPGETVRICASITLCVSTRSAILLMTSSTRSATAFL